MAIINRRYSDYFKKKYHFTGQLYERRYFAELVPSPTSLLAVSRYIHRNPIETKTPIVKKMEHYPYSSFHYYKLDIPSPYPFLNTALLQDNLPQNTVPPRQAYCQYCEEERAEQLQH